MSSPIYRTGDLVRIGTGDNAFHAEVRQTHRDGLLRGRLMARPIYGRDRLSREVLVREVSGHWRRVR